MSRAALLRRPTRLAQTMVPGGLSRPPGPAGAPPVAVTKGSLQGIVTATLTNLNRLAKLLAPGQRLVPQAA
jgi:hypothetical protein